MATNASLYPDGLRREESLTFERRIALLQWHYLQQPFNPFAEMAHNAHKASKDKKSPELGPLPFYFKELLFKRFSNLDELSTLMRMEMLEEVAGIPGDGHALPSVLEETEARDKLRIEIRTEKRRRSQDDPPARENAELLRAALELGTEYMEKLKNIESNDLLRNWGEARAAAVEALNKGEVPQSVLDALRERNAEVRTEYDRFLQADHPAELTEKRARKAL